MSIEVPKLSNSTNSHNKSSNSLFVVNACHVSKSLLPSWGENSNENSRKLMGTSTHQCPKVEVEWSSIGPSSKPSAQNQLQSLLCSSGWRIDEHIVWWRRFSLFRVRLEFERKSNWRLLKTPDTFNSPITKILYKCSLLSGEFVIALPCKNNNRGLVDSPTKSTKLFVELEPEPFDRTS